MKRRVGDTYLTVGWWWMHWCRYWPSHPECHTRTQRRPPLPSHRSEWTNAAAVYCISVVMFHLSLNWNEHKHIVTNRLKPMCTIYWVVNTIQHTMYWRIQQTRRWTCWHYGLVLVWGDHLAPPGTAVRTRSTTWGRGSDQSLPPSAWYPGTKRHSSRRNHAHAVGLYARAGINILISRWS